MEKQGGDSGSEKLLACLPRFDGASGLSFLSSFDWWSLSARSALRFAPICLPCGLGLAFANIIVVWVYYFFEQQMKSLQAHPEQLIERLAFLALVLLIGVAAGLVLSLWALTKWLFNLTAYARCLVNASSLPGKDEFSQSRTYVADRRGYLAKLWLVASLYLLVPVLPLSVLISLKVVTGPEFMIQGKPIINLPDWVHVASIVGAGFLSTISAAYTLSTVVFSAVSQAPPWATATESLRQCCIHWRSVLVMTVSVVVLNVLISSPQVIFILTPLFAIIQSNLALNVGCQLWLGIMSLWLWPLSLAPFCELVRRGAC